MLAKVFDKLLGLHILYSATLWLLCIHVYLHQTSERKQPYVASFFKSLFESNYNLEGPEF